MPHFEAWLAYEWLWSSRGDEFGSTILDASRRVYGANVGPTLAQQCAGVDASAAKPARAYEMDLVLPPLSSPTDSSEPATLCRVQRL